VIQIPVTPDEADRQAALKKAQAARKRIVDGERFARVAQDASEDPGSARSGGDLGFFGKGTMDPAFEAAAFSLPIGQVSEPIESPFGWHVIEVIERDNAKTAAGKDSLGADGKPVPEAHARHILIRTAIDEADVERARKLATDVRNRAAGGENFGELVKKYSKFPGPAGPDGDLGFISLASLQPQIRAGLEQVKLGGISEPVATPAGFNIFKVIERRDERPYTLDEIKDDLPQVVAQIQQRERFEGWVKGLREKSHIEIRGS
jgi:peptidyl-prolyl cis-trans isomerase D